MKVVCIFFFTLIAMYSEAQRVVISGDICDNTPNCDYSYINYNLNPHHFGYNIFRNDKMVFHADESYSYIALGGLQFINDSVGFKNEIASNYNGYLRSLDSGRTWSPFSGFRIKYLWDPHKFYNFYFINKDNGYMGLYTNDSIFLYRLPYNNQYGNPELLHVKYDSVSSNFIVNDTLRTDDYGCGQLNHLLFTWYFEDDTIQVDLQFTRLPGLGQKEVHDLKLKVFPNPTSGKVSLQLNSRDTYQIKIFDLTGRNLFTKSYKDTDEIELEMPDDPGIYLLEILEPRGIRTIRKIIRE